MPAGISTSDFYYILPELVLTAGALLLLVADVLLPRAQQGARPGVTLVVLGATLASRSCRSPARTSRWRTG